MLAGRRDSHNRNQNYHKLIILLINDDKVCYGTVQWEFRYEGAALLQYPTTWTVYIAFTENCLKAHILLRYKGVFELVKYMTTVHGWEV